MINTEEKQRRWNTQKIGDLKAENKRKGTESMQKVIIQENFPEIIIKEITYCTAYLAIVSQTDTL